MEFGICNISVIPVRSQPSDTSEMTTQILFGELFKKIDTYKNWYKVQLDFDNYIGWIDSKQCILLNEAECELIYKSHLEITQELVQLVIINGNYLLPLLIGSNLYGLKKNIFKIKDTSYEFDGASREFSHPTTKNEVIENAYLYINAPYLWGGRSPFGIDCSGFTQMVYKLCGVPLSRDAHQQAEQGETINLISEALPGDLLFFENADKKIIHTGILLDQNRIIHASGKVRIDKIDHEGIFNSEINSYTHKLRLIKRILN